MATRTTKKPADGASSHGALSVEQGVAGLSNLYGLYTRSPQMAGLFDLLGRVARSEATVLVRGESGTGKELVARAIHDLSPRSAGPFRAVNCASFTPELLASELFGHVRGAFTGAVRDSPGLFRAANGGTVFLDEVAEMPIDLQARLLRVLQERTFVPVGGTEPVRVNVRVVSATHRALRREVEAGRFREDLMYRLRVVPIWLPPLRERDGDVLALASWLLQGFNAQGPRQVQGLSADAVQAILQWPWPGNVRELRNAMEYAMVVGQSDWVTLADLPPELRGEEPPDADPRRQIDDPRTRERGKILAALHEADGQRGAAADLLGMSRSTLWRKLREYGIASR